MSDPKIKKDIITLAGRPGSGKSSTAVRLAKHYGFQHFSSGDLFRAIARERGIDVFQANVNAEKEETDDIDALVDGRLQQIGETEDQLVIDSRTAWHWIPQSFKVFLDLDLEVAAERILGETNTARLQSEQVHDDVEAYAVRLQERLDSESRRYLKLYDIDPYDMGHYDLVINTGEHSVEQVVEQIIAKFNDWRMPSTLDT